MATTESALKLMADLREKSFASAQVDFRLSHFASLNLWNLGPRSRSRAILKLTRGVSGTHLTILERETARYRRIGRFPQLTFWRFTYLKLI